MNMNFSCEICAVQARTTQNKNRTSRDRVIAHTDCQADSNVQWTIFSHMKMLCVCCVNAHRTPAAAAAENCNIASCIFIVSLYTFHSGFGRCGNMTNANAMLLQSTFNAMRPFQFVGLSLTFHVIRTCTCVVCVQKENMKKVKETDRRAKKWEKNADTDGNEIKNEQCTHTNKQTKKYHYSLVDGTSCILRAEEGNVLDVELNSGNGMNWIE